MAPSGGPIQTIRFTPDRLLERSPYPVLATCCTAMFLDLTNLSAITIALPAVQKSFGTSSSELQWVLAGYALTFGGFLLLGGRGGDLLGHRSVLMFGSIVFAVFTLCCAIAPSFIPLVIFRALQGIGAAFTIPSAQAHIGIIFTDPKRKATALGYWGAAGSVGFVAGLILGGVLTSVLSWRWIFYISAMLSLVVVIAEFLILPHREIGARIKSRLIGFDVLGMFLGIPGLLLLSYALSSGQDKGWGSTQVVAIILVSVFMLILFVLHERVATSPLLSPKLFKQQSFNLTLVLAVFTYAIRQATTYFLTIQLQQYGNSPIHTSVLFLPIGVSATIIGMTAGKLVPLLGARLMFSIGWALSIPGVVLFIFVTPTSSYWVFTFPGMILYVAGLGAVYITANFVVVSSVDKADQGSAAGLFNVALQIGGSVIGLTIMTAIAQAINQSFGHAQGTNAAYTQVAYRSVYYSCVILGVVGLLLSMLAIRVPENLSGTYWKKKTEQPSPSSAESGMAGATSKPKSAEDVHQEEEAAKEESEDVPLTEMSFSKPRPVHRDPRRSSWRSSVHSMDLHAVSWLELEESNRSFRGG